MPNDLPFTAVGNVTADAELRYTRSGTPVASFTIAHTPRYFDRQSNEWKDRDALFIRCSAWRDLAEHVAESISKGARVIATGSLRANVWQDKNGQERRDFVLDVDEIGPSLLYATAIVSKVAKGGGRPPHPAEQAQSTTPSQGNDPWGGQSDAADTIPF